MSDPLPPIPPIPSIEPIPSMGDPMGFLRSMTFDVLPLVLEGLSIPAALLESAGRDAIYAARDAALRMFQASLDRRFLQPDLSQLIEFPDPPRNPNAKAARR